MWPITWSKIINKHSADVCAFQQMDDRLSSSFSTTSLFFTAHHVLNNIHAEMFLRSSKSGTVENIASLKLPRCCVSLNFEVNLRARISKYINTVQIVEMGAKFDSCKEGSLLTSMDTKFQCCDKCFFLILAGFLNSNRLMNSMNCLRFHRELK